MSSRAIRDMVKQVPPVHFATEVDVAEDDFHVAAGLEDGDGFGGIFGLDDEETGVLQKVGGRNADQRLVLNHEENLRE